MRIINGKAFIDDVSLIRTDGHSVTVRDPTGTSLVIPVNVLYEIVEEVNRVLSKEEKKK